MRNWRKVILFTVTFLLMIFLLLSFFKTKPKEININSTVFGSNYRLVIELPHEYIEMKCSFQNRYIQPRLLKIGDGVNLYEVLFEGIIAGEYSCKLSFERNDGYQSEMTYFFTILGSEL